MPLPDAQAAFASLNTHRADCLGQHPFPCEPWPVRQPRVTAFLKASVQASVYSFQECMPEQAAGIAADLGWGGSYNPPYAWDENQNVVMYDRGKWRDLEVWQRSLAAIAGDDGDAHQRSVNWVLLEHRATGRRCWFGSSHLESGDAEARAAQAKVLVAALPDVYPLILGLDRNSYTLGAGSPRATFAAAGLTEAELSVLANDPQGRPPGERSFHGWTDPIMDGKCIDGHHTRGVVVRASKLISTAGLAATDHSAGRLSFTLTG